MIYTITCLEKINPIGKNEDWCDYGGSRCFGYYFDKSKAFESLHNNNTDMRETVYDFAVVEEYEEGISQYVEKRQFFQWDNSKQGFFEIEEPQCVKHLCNFAIG